MNIMRERVRQEVRERERESEMGSLLDILRLGLPADSNLLELLWD